MSITISSDETVGTGVFPSAAHPRAELAVRDQNGVAVTLFWLRGTDVTIVSVLDKRNGDGFELVLESDDRPLDVFHHPYAYAAVRGLDAEWSTPDEDTSEEDMREEEIVDV